MKRKQAPIPFGRIPKNYAGLCRLLSPRPIRDKGQAQEVKALTDAMAGQKLNTDQKDYFDLLCRLVDDYEQKQATASAKRMSGLAALRHLLEEHDLCGADLSRLLGTHRTLGTMILHGDRHLTVEHIRKLCERFQVSADLFITK
jgi:HTH-type transcriptional regulator/antitoxin HigA